MCLIKGDIRGNIPWYFGGFESQKKSIQKVELRSTSCQYLAGIFLQHFVFDLLLYLTPKSDWLWWWDHKLGLWMRFQNYSLVEKPFLLLSPKRIQELGAWITSWTLQVLDSQEGNNHRDGRPCGGGCLYIMELKGILSQKLSFFFSPRRIRKLRGSFLKLSKLLQLVT